MESKTCYSCKQHLPITDFYGQSDRKNGASICKKCFNKYCIDRWKARKREFVDFKGGCCSACGYNKSLNALEFHHLVPEDKEFNWTKMRLRSRKSILEELDKCILLCSNCHRELHDVALSS